MGKVLLVDDERKRGLALLLGGTFLIGATGYLRVPYVGLVFLGGGLALVGWGLAYLLRPQHPAGVGPEGTPELGWVSVWRLGAGSAPTPLGTEVDPQHQDPVLDGAGGVAHHGEVLVVELGPFHELPTGDSFEGRKRATMASTSNSSPMVRNRSQDGPGRR